MQSVVTAWTKESLGWEPLGVPHCPITPCPWAASWGRGDRLLPINCSEWSLPGAGLGSFLTKPHWDGPPRCMTCFPPLVGVHGALCGVGWGRSWVGQEQHFLAFFLPTAVQGWAQVPPHAEPPPVSFELYPLMPVPHSGQGAWAQSQQHLLENCRKYLLPAVFVSCDRCDPRN